jgi:glucosylceramidase
LEPSDEGVVNPTQPILGFGGAFTEASALNFGRLLPAGQEAVLELLFGKTGLGYSIGRIPIHSCDFSVQSYNFDNEDGDFELQHFDTQVQHDVDNGMVDFAQRAVEKFRQSWGKDAEDDNSTTATTSTDEQFRLYASPWSPPAWMKRPTWADPKHAEYSSYMTGSATPNCIRDGVGPHSKYAAAWALYFSKYVTAYQEQHNLQLWAVTVQNEPEFPAPWEACAYTPANMTDFVAYHLGPTLQRDHPQLKILGFDHNKDHINHWAMTMLNGTDDDPDSTFVESSAIAARYLAGTAYHWYAGGECVIRIAAHVLSLVMSRVLTLALVVSRVFDFGCCAFLM